MKGFILGVNVTLIVLALAGAVFGFGVETATNDVITACARDGSFYADDVRYLCLKQPEQPE